VFSLLAAGLQAGDVIFFRGKTTEKQCASTKTPLEHLIDVHKLDHPSLAVQDGGSVN
jgi:hypothetical protein